MNRLQFLELLNTEHQKIVETNKKKGHDYAGDEDALANFKSAADRLGLKPEQVWAVYADKHWSAIMTYCKEGAVKSEPIEGRITDAILYLYLLLGLIKDNENQSRITGAEEFSVDQQATQKIKIPDLQQKA